MLLPAPRPQQSPAWIASQNLRQRACTEPDSKLRMPPAAGMQLSTAIAGGAEGAATDSEHVRVCVRLRPLSQHELQNGDAEKVWFEVGSSFRLDCWFLLPHVNHRLLCCFQGSTVVCHHTSADADRPRTADYTGKPRSVGRRFAVDQCIGVQTDQEETFEKSGELIVDT
eukprot:SAG31_NODE_940_length_10870_cov_12.600501_12_plen_169_part_00